jgi:hypothetical protein
MAGPVENYFKLGNCMNPNGRPKGSGTRQMLFRTVLSPELPSLLRKAIAMAYAGDQAMLKFLCAYGLPVKSMVENLYIQSNTASNTVSNLINYTETGDLNAEDAGRIAHIVQKDAELANQSLLLDRINALELRLANLNQADIKVLSQPIETKEINHGGEMDTKSP